MIATPTSLARQPDFQRAYVALRYFFGARGAELGSGLEGGGGRATSELVGALTSAERNERARALGAELGRLKLALEQRSLLR